MCEDVTAVAVAVLVSKGAPHDPVPRHRRGAPRPDTSDMYAVHGVFRDTLGAATALVGGVAGRRHRPVGRGGQLLRERPVVPARPPRGRGRGRLPVAPRALPRERCAGRRAGGAARGGDGPAGHGPAVAGGVARWRRRRAARAGGRAGVAADAPGRTPRRGGAPRPAAGGRVPLGRGVGPAARPRPARLRRGQGLADPRADPRAHERVAARRHARTHAAARRRDVDGIRGARLHGAGLRGARWRC